MHPLILRLLQQSRYPPPIPPHQPQTPQMPQHPCNHPRHARDTLEEEAAHEPCVRGEEVALRAEGGEGEGGVVGGEGFVGVAGGEVEGFAEGEWWGQYGE